MAAVNAEPRAGLTNSAGDARERLLTAAYELFSRQGVQAVGIDAIIERSGVARQTMYRHFGSKQELVLAFLQPVVRSRRRGRSVSLTLSDLVCSGP